MSEAQRLAFLEGFVQKCAEHNMDPEKLLEKIAAGKGQELQPGSLKGGKSQPASKAKPGSGGRFKALKKKIHGVEDPGAVAAAIGRAKYGKKKFQAMATKGKKAASAVDQFEQAFQLLKQYNPRLVKVSSSAKDPFKATRTLGGIGGLAGGAAGAVNLGRLGLHGVGSPKVKALKVLLNALVGGASGAISGGVAGAGLGLPADFIRGVRK